MRPSGRAVLAPAGRRQRGVTLIELVTATAIMTVISAMLLIGWFALSRSYAFSVHSADARDSGRQAIQRMQREIRDTQKPPQGYLGTSSWSAPDAIIFRARAYWIAFSTTFNDVGNELLGVGTPTPTPSPSRPHLVVYRLYSDRELWRFEDLNVNGTIDVSSGAPFDTTSDWVTDTTEQVRAEGATLLCANVVNRAGSDPSKWVPLFRYNFYDDAGVLAHDDRVIGADRESIIAVEIRLIVDLDPTRAPLFADLRATAQLRNARY